MPFVVLHDGKVLLEDGAVKVSESSPPPDECCCGGPSCCPELAPNYPASLTATITGHDGCECLTQELEITGGGASPTWSALMHMCNPFPFVRLTMIIACTVVDGVAQWTFSQNECFCDSSNFVGELVSCNPLHIRFTGIPRCDPQGTGDFCCEGSIDIEVTE